MLVERVVELLLQEVAYELVDCDGAAGAISLLPSFVLVWLSNTGSCILTLTAATMPLRMSEYSYPLPENSLIVRLTCSLKAERWVPPWGWCAVR